MTTAGSLASGALGAVAVALAWLVSHSALIKRLLDLLPGMAADAATARAAVEHHGLTPAVSRVEATLSADAQASITKLLAALERQITPMSEPVAGSTPTPAPADGHAAAAPAPASTTTPMAAPAGAPDGATYTVHGGQLIPAAPGAAG